LQYSEYFEFWPLMLSPLPMHIETAPAYELLMTLGVISDAEGREAYELNTRWFERVRQQASPALLARIESLTASDKPWAHLISLAYEAPRPRDVSAFLAYLEHIDAMELRLRFLGYYMRAVRRLTPPDVIMAAAVGNRQAQEAFLRTSFLDDDGWQQTLLAVLPLDAETTRASVCEILRGWNDRVFQALEGELMPILERDADSKEALRRTGSVERVMAAALPGFDYVPEPGLQQVLLIPSFVIRPQIHSLDHADTKIFVYSVADESIAAGSDAPHPRLLRLARALGDERRLRVLKRLTAGDWTLHELATHFGVSDTTMLHHLIILRGAGLVRVRGGAGKRYRLERHVLPEMGRLLESYLGPTETCDGD
jgi:DNA-binding transcriptional ArsR family regulator